MIKKIVITGPESSGKTTLARQLAAHFQTEWVPEFARTFLEELHRPYQREDLLDIAIGQVQLELQRYECAHQFLFCDTGLEVIKIWSMVKYQQVDPKIEQLLAQRSYHQYLLCTPDLDWEPDPLRETTKEEERWHLFEYYQRELQQLGIPWTTVFGTGRSRLNSAIAAVEGGV